MWTHNQASQRTFWSVFLAYLLGDKLKDYVLSYFSTFAIQINYYIMYSDIESCIERTIVNPNFFVIFGKITPLSDPSEPPVAESKA